MAERVTAGTTSHTIDVFLQDSSSATGNGLTGLTHSTTGLTAYYRKGGAGAPTAITLATQTATGAWTSGGFAEVDATNMPGVYRLDLPNAVIDSAGYATVYLQGAANLLQTALRIDCKPVPAAVQTIATDAIGADAIASDAVAEIQSGLSTFDATTDAVTVGTNNDKTAYSLSSSGLNAVTAWTVALTGNLTGNVTGSVGSVTSPVTAGTVTDKTGYSLSSSGLNAVTAWTVALTGNLTGNVTGSVGSVTSPVTAGTVTDKTGYSLSTAGNTAVVNSLFARIPTKANQHTVERIFWNNDRTSIVDDGEVVANVANTAQSFETTLTGMADKYNDSLIQFTSGALEGESNSIASMDAAGVITFHDAFTTVPSAADEFIVRPVSNHSPEEIAAAVEALLSATTRSELASAPAANASLADKLTWLAQLARNKMQSTALQQTLYADDGTTVVATFAVSDDGTTATRGEAT